MTRAAFDHVQPGTAEPVWTAALDALPMAALPDGVGTLVVLAAHPDDETLGAGGLIAAAAGNGWRVRVLVASDGDASHPRSPTTSPLQLATRRRREVSAAMAALGERIELTFGALPDGGLADHTAPLAELLRGLLDGPCLLVAPWRHDRHPDHEACAAVAEAVAGGAVELWEYPVWAWHWGTPATVDLAPMRRVPLPEPARRAKRAALACHASQHRPLSPAAGDEAILQPEMLAHFDRDFETFQLIAPATSPAYFDELYRQSPDPWGLAERFYEQRKRELLIASLPRRSFTRAFEPGCATGLLTERLVQRCRAVVAVDSSPRAVELARARVTATSATVEVGRIPEDWPAGHFDLIVLSEVGYYCPDLDGLLDRVEQSLTDDGVVIACHWRHPAADHPHTADQVHAALAQRLVTTMTHEERDFRLELFSRDGRSVAEAEGIV